MSTRLLRWISNYAARYRLKMEPLWSYSRSAANNVRRFRRGRSNRRVRLLDRAVRERFVQTTADAIATDFCLPPPLSPCVHTGSHTWAVWRQETKRGSEARTFDIAFLRGPGPPQRGAGSINRISGRSLIIPRMHARSPKGESAQKQPGIFSLSRARRNPISAPCFLLLLSLKRRRELLRKDNGPIARAIVYAILLRFHPILLRGDCRAAFLLEERKLLRARRKKNGAQLIARRSDLGVG